MAKPILVVEDDDDIRESLIMLLQEEGYTVLGAEHGRAALDVLSKIEEPPGLVLLDLMMPVMDGAELLPILRTHETVWFRNVPIVVITAASLNEARQQSVLALATGVLKKPVGIDVLVALAKEHCGEPRR